MFEVELLTDSGRDVKMAYEPHDIKKGFKFGHCSAVGSSSKRRPYILRRALYLDTETSWNHDEENPIGWIYQWGFEFNKKLYCGRTPIQFCHVLEKIIDYYGLNAKRKIVIYIHNASYDFSYLKDWLIKFFGEPVDYIATRPYKYINIEFEKFIIRDSWILSNRSLYKWANDLKTTYRKALGAIDYDLINYQDTKLKPNDWYYQMSDAMALKSCVIKEMGTRDNLQTLPLTSTSFVRRDTRELFNTDIKYRDKFEKTALNEETYGEADVSFAGGLSHGNRHYAGIKIKHEGGHIDFRSFYPSAVRCSNEFMADVPVRMYDITTNPRHKWNVSTVLKKSETYAMFITAKFKNLEIKKGVTFPIISTNKILSKSEGCHFIKDNGRLLKADGSILMTVTHLDFKWIVDQYTCEKCQILKVTGAPKGRAPEWLQDITDDYFFKKSELGEKLDDLKANNASVTEIYNCGIDRMKSKNKLNGIYGMTATRPVRNEFKFDFEHMEWELLSNENITEKLQKYYGSRNNFMSFQHGVFVTAFCRSELLNVIKNYIGYDKAWYCDTDSVFYAKDEETEAAVKKYNENNYKARIKNGQFIKTGSGKIVEYMALEDEKDDIQQFKFLHSKCYGFTNSKKELHVTIAGVTPFWREDMGIEDISKRRTREMELGSLDNLVEGFKFTHCGGTRSIYVNEKPRILNLKGHLTQTASACIITNVTKTLSELDYDELNSVEFLEEGYSNDY